MVDCWNANWYEPQRMDVLAPRINAALKAARPCVVIHAPSDTMDAYAGHPARERVPQGEVHCPPVLGIASPIPVPNQGRATRVWTAQHPAIEIEETDYITDEADRILTLLYQECVREIVYVGVALNVCLLNRPFGLRAMSRYFSVYVDPFLVDITHDGAQPHEDALRQSLRYAQQWAGLKVL